MSGKNIGKEKNAGADQTAAGKSFKAEKSVMTENSAGTKKPATAGKSSMVKKSGISSKSAVSESFSVPEKPALRTGLFLAFVHSGIAAFMVVLVVLSLFLLRMYSNNLVDDVTQTLSLQYSRELNTQMAAHISGTMDHYLDDLELEYKSLKLIEGIDEEKLVRFIADTEKTGDISYLAFADDDGYLYEADGSCLGTMRIPVIGRLLNGEKRIVTDNVTVGSESYVMVGASFEDPIRMGDRNIRIGLMGISSDELSEAIILRSDYSGGYTSIIHTDGSYVLKNPSEPFGGLNVFSIISKNSLATDAETAALRQAVENGEAYMIRVDRSDMDLSAYLYFAPISDTDWYAVNTLPSSFIKDSVGNLSNDLEHVFTVAIVLILSAAAVVIMLQMVSRNRLKKSHKDLQAALKLAEEASGAKTAFLFNMSHDIRTPMNAILGYTDIGLRHVNEPQTASDSFRKIKMAGGHLLDLINDVLEMSRIESGKMELTEKPLDIRKAIEDIDVMSRELAKNGNIDFKTETWEFSDPYICADELHINEVIINLISNAIKYTPKNGRVRYRVEQLGAVTGGKVLYRFEVSDNGMGMSAEFQKHLFESFSREQNTTVSKIEGTGLGLSIVKKIVDLAGGEIRVKSVQHEGSVFTVEIPFRVPEQSEIETLIEEQRKREAPGGSLSDISFNGKRVLLAEDNALNREIAVSILEDAGLAVETAEDGRIAVDMIREKGAGTYDFILMDIQMPVMNGYEATREIRRIPGGDSIPIIALSANAFEEDKRKSVEEGMNAHVAKPIDIDELLETIRGLVR